MDSDSVSGALPRQILNTARHTPPSSTAHQREMLLPLCCHYDSVLWSFQRLTTRCGHITIGCGFPSSKGASLSKARTGIFSCLNLKRSSAKFVLPEETEMQEVTSLHSLSHTVLPRAQRMCEPGVLPSRQKPPEAIPEFLIS